MRKNVTRRLSNGILKIIPGRYEIYATPGSGQEVGSLTSVLSNLQGYACLYKPMGNLTSERISIPETFILFGNETIDVGRGI